MKDGKIFKNALPKSQLNQPVSMNRLPLAIPSLILIAGAMVVLAQDVPSKTPTTEDLAKDNQLFLNLAGKALKWEEPTEPVKIAGPLYYVGTRGLGSYLFVTGEGNILFNSGMPSSGPMIVESIKKLGFKPEDTKLIINGHAHSDHAGAIAFLRENTGAQVAIMSDDAQAIEDGGKDDFHYGWDWKVMGFPPCKVDRILRDGEQIKLGEVLLTAHHTPGHTRGATTWVANIVADGRALTVVWPDGGGFNPGYRVAKNPSYPGMTDDYRRTHHLLEMLKPDMFLGSHAEWFGLEEKKGRAVAEGIDAWINPEEYRRFVAMQKRAFEDQVDREMGVPSSGK
jgi:metallo-beta-lactamase class B